MKKRRKSDFYRLRFNNALNQERAAELCGVSVRTIRNWDAKGAPLAVMRLLRLRLGDLSAMHPDWRGFRICPNGKLYGPERLQLPSRVIRDYPRFCKEFSRLSFEVETLRGRLSAPALPAPVSQPVTIWLPDSVKASMSGASP